MKNFKYKILNPGGNKTALVINNNYSDDEKKIINNIILKENKDVEQVGFISEKYKNLEMAGREFCVNATRCAIWEYLNHNFGKLNIKVSGYKEMIGGGIDKQGNVYVKIKINKKFSDVITIKEKLNFVELDGILLAAINEDNSKEYINDLKINPQKTKIKLKEIMKKINSPQNAVGIILTEKKGKGIQIYPIIWVKTIDTLFYETACGSGSLAVAIYKNYIENIKDFKIIQPSGYSFKVNLDVNLDYIKDATIYGKVIEENGGIKYGRI